VRRQEASDRGGVTRRSRITWETVRWPVTAAAVLVVFVLGYVGFSRRFPGLSATDVVYRTLRLFVFEGGDVEPPAPWMLDVARFAAPVVAGLTAMVALAVLFREQAQLLRARRMRDHVVVCGLGERGVLLAMRFKETGRRVACIEVDESDPHVSQCRARGIPVIVGDAGDPGSLRRVRAQRAAIVVAVCDSDQANANVATVTRELQAESGRAPLTCLAHITDLELCTLLRRAVPPAVGDYHLALFNVNETGARMVLDDHPFRRRDGITPHIVVVGLGKMGRALVAAAAGRWTGDGALRVTAIDRVATRKHQQLLLRYPEIGVNCQVRALDMEKESSEFERADYLCDADGNPDTDAVYLCFEDDAHALTSAITIRRRIADPRVPVVVRLTGIGGLESLVPPEPGLHPFGLHDRTCVPDLLLAAADTTYAEKEVR
jgi:voltage-gated potassium channel Kch